MLRLTHVTRNNVVVTLTDTGTAEQPYALNTGPVRQLYADFRDAMDDFAGTIGFDVTDS